MKIGAVMPAFNHGEYVLKAIKSVTGQVEELVIVDDGSTDNTPQVLSERNEMVVTLDANGGAANAINTGISALRSMDKTFDWFTWVSSDNVHYT